MRDIIDTTGEQQSLEEIEGQMLDQPQVDCPVAHYFGPDIYIREAQVPAGTMVMGHAHKAAHTTALIKGKMAVLMDEEVHVIEAPAIFTAPAGRKLAYIIEDLVIQNIFATSETDLEKLEDQLVDKSETWSAHRLQSSADLLLSVAGEEA